MGQRSERRGGDTFRNQVIRSEKWILTVRSVFSASSSAGGHKRQLGSSDSLIYFLKDGFGLMVPADINKIVEQVGN